MFFRELDRIQRNQGKFCQDYKKSRIFLVVCCHSTMEESEIVRKLKCQTFSEVFDETLSRSVGISSSKLARIALCGEGTQFLHSRAILPCYWRLCKYHR